MGCGLSGAIAWLASPVIAEAEAARPTREDLADAAPLGPAQGAARLQRRTLLRALAARALGCDEAAVHFAREGEGRARLTAPAAAHASAASRDGWVAAALGPRPLGVDVELARPEPPLPLDLLRPSDAARLAALPAIDQAPAFARLWVEREAWAKAAGLPLDAALSETPVLEPAVRADAEVVAALVEL